MEARWKITVGSYRAVGSVPGSDHPKGLALDCMTTNLAIGNEIEAWALSHPSWCKYTIWQRRYKEPDGTNDPYTGPSPHTDHVHISLLANSTFTADGGFPVTPAGFEQTGLGDVSGSITALFGIFTKLLSFVTNPGNWLRMGLFLLGAGLVFAAALKVVTGNNLDYVQEVMDSGPEAV